MKAGVKVYNGDPWIELDHRVWVMLSSGGARTMNMDLRLYKGVEHRIYCIGTVGRHEKPFYSFWVKRKSFREHGHRFL